MRAIVLLNLLLGGLVASLSIVLQLLANRLEDLGQWQVLLLNVEPQLLLLDSLPCECGWGSVGSSLSGMRGERAVGRSRTHRSWPALRSRRSIQRPEQSERALSRGEGSSTLRKCAKSAKERRKREATPKLTLKDDTLVGLVEDGLDDSTSVLLARGNRRESGNSADNVSWEREETPSQLPAREEIAESTHRVPRARQLAWES